MKAKEQDLQLIYRLDKTWEAETIKVRKAGGQTNKNFVVVHNGQSFFVRLPWERSAPVAPATTAKVVTIPSFAPYTESPIYVPCRNLLQNAFIPLEIHLVYSRERCV